MNNHIATNQARAARLFNPSSLTDSELLSRIPTLVSRERAATATLVAHLVELEARRLYLGQGCPSMFAYCVQVLHFSECQAYARIEGARVARRFPVVLEMLERGDVHLSAVGLLAPCLNEANHLELLTAARHKTKREVERLVAELRPRPTVPDAIRKLPEARAFQESPDRPRAEGSAPKAEDGAVGAMAFAEGPAALSAELPAARPAARRPGVEPLGADRWKVQFTASSHVVEMLRVAQDLLRHQVPDGDLDRVFDRALSALVEQLSRSKFAATGPRRAKRRASAPAPSPADRPAIRPDASADAPSEASPAVQRERAGVPARPTRHIPAEVRRQVWTRDAGQCAFIGARERRCRESGYVEFHHVTPFARGGAASIENIELRCRAHNQYEADLCFGTGSGPS